MTQNTLYSKPQWYMRECPNISGLAAWSKNYKCYSSLPLHAVISLFCESSKFCHHNPLCCFSAIIYCCCLFCYQLSLETFGYILIYNTQILF